jgi:hypothetical protein
VIAKTLVLPFLKHRTMLVLTVEEQRLNGNNAKISMLATNPNGKRPHQTRQTFSMTDLGPVAFYLGMTVTRDRKNRILRLGQRSYLEEGIKTKGLRGSHPQKTSINTGRPEPAGEDYCAEPGFKTQYQSAVGTLMYAMMGTRPDIASAVSSVSRCCKSNPSTHDSGKANILIPQGHR